MMQMSIKGEKLLKVLKDPKVIASTIIFVVLTLIVSAAINFETLTMLMPKHMLTVYAENGQISEIIKYVEDNSAKISMRQGIEHAIKLISESKNEEGIKYLDDLFYTNGNFTYISQSIVKNFNENGLALNSVDKLCWYCVDIKTDNEATEEAIAMLRMCDSDDIYTNSLQVIEYYYNKDLYIAASKANLFGKLNNKYTNDIRRLITLIEEIIKAQNELDDSDTDKELEKLNAELNEARNYNANNKYLTLSAYIVGERAPNEYEIAWVENKGYGKTLSDWRGILRTNKTTFTSKGEFYHLPVILSGTVDVKLKNELGGFTQKWNFYREANEDDLPKILANDKLIKENTDKIFQIQFRRSEITSKIFDNERLIQEYFYPKQ